MLAVHDLIMRSQVYNASTRINLRTRNDNNKTQPNHVYERQLLEKQRGFPLWMPECNLSWRVEKQKQGICVGDVGLITKNGSFTYLFNITVPVGHPVQPSSMPEGYEPIQTHAEGDISTCMYFKPRSCLTSLSVKSKEVDAEPPIFLHPDELAFQISAAEGAILTLPKGAMTMDMDGNIGGWRDYMAQHIESWYTYVNCRQRREAKNGDIRLVTGCDKASFWGVAAAMKHPGTHQLRFRPASGDLTESVYHVWQWTPHNGLETRTGPSVGEVRYLQPDTTGDHQLYNQCVFLRTMNAMLSDDAWIRAHNGVTLAASNGSESTSAQHWSSIARANLPTPGRNPGTSTGYSNILSWTGSHSYAGGVCDDAEAQLRHYTDNHPSDIINQYLLDYSPQSDVAITHDNDWISLLEEDSEFPDDEGLLCTLISTRKVCIDQGSQDIFAVSNAQTTDNMAASGSRHECGRTHATRESS
ncbi:hypothetical protein BJ165DRAFT_767792 [Panaeolus papilionaceus]|nr:hypothetical protein BJ165DRAFT_767792 [Panaeolus papilionaceus]